MSGEPTLSVLPSILIRAPPAVLAVGANCVSMMYFKFSSSSADPVGNVIVTCFTERGAALTSRAVAAAHVATGSAACSAPVRWMDRRIPRSATVLHGGNTAGASDASDLWYSRPVDSYS